jgi:tripartite ATP-independent transporter DctM subunit
MVVQPTTPVDLPAQDAADGTTAAAAASSFSQKWVVRRLVDRASMVLLLAALVGELVIVIVNVLLRKLTGGAIEWEPEVTQLGLAVFAFVGGATAYASGSNFSIGYFVSRLPPSWGSRVREGVDALIIVISIGQVYQEIRLIRADWSQVTPVLQFSQSWLSAPLLLGSLLFAFYGVCRIRDVWAGWRTLASTAVVALLAIVLTVTVWTYGAPLVPSAVDPTSAVLFIGLLVLGVPIPFVLITSTVTVTALVGMADNEVIPQTVSASTASFLYVAVPFFVLAGLLMASSGVSTRLASFVASLVGRLPGGFYHVIVVTMYLFSGLSGSKLADTVALGSPLGEMLDRYGYEREEGAAVLAASAVMGETVPPSLAIIILGSVTSLSIGTMFIAGLLPAAVIAVFMMIYIALRARRVPRPAQAPAGWSVRTIGRTGLAAIPGLVLPVLLIGGIVGGIATPTEVSSFAVLYGLVLIAVYRTGLRSLWNTLSLALSTAGMVLFLLSSASAFSWLLAYAQIPQDVANWITAHIAYPWLFLLLSIVALVVFGAVLEGAAAIIILAPLLLPVATHFGINGIQYGLVLIISMGIGTHLPPVGLGMYVACGSMDVPVERVTRRFLNYLGVLLVGVLAIAFVSAFTVALPHLFGKQ